MKKCFGVILAIMGIAFTSCTNDKNGKAIKPSKGEVKSKPPSSFSDTLRIDSGSAVFYSPDSLQLEKIKAVTEKNIFESSMHEYFYQLRYIHKVLNVNWPDIRIVEAKNIQYLEFLKADLTTVIIDLNTKNDAYGLFLFVPSKEPAQLELTNAESEIGFYLSSVTQSGKNK